MEQVRSRERDVEAARQIADVLSIDRSMKERLNAGAPAMRGLYAHACRSNKRGRRGPGRAHARGAACAPTPADQRSPMERSRAGAREAGPARSRLPIERSTAESPARAHVRGEACAFTRPSGRPDARRGTAAARVRRGYSTSVNRVLDEGKAQRQRRGVYAPLPAHRPIDDGEGRAGSRPRRGLRAHACRSNNRRRRGPGRAHVRRRADAPTPCRSNDRQRSGPGQPQVRAGPMPACRSNDRRRRGPGPAHVRRRRSAPRRPIDDREVQGGRACEAQPMRLHLPIDRSTTKRSKAGARATKGLRTHA